MFKRRISKDKYLVAGIITGLIFILGLTLGIILEGYRNNWIENVNKDQENNFQSLQLQYLYLTSLGDSQTSCPVLQTTLKKALEDLSGSLSDFLEYKKDSQLNKNEFELAGRRYLLDNIRYWFFAQNTKKKCNSNVLPIFYFYSEGCKTCPLQGTILTYYRKLFDKKVLVFPLNVHFKKKEPMLALLLSRYNVSQYPTLIIDEKKHQGLVGKDQLKKIICSSLDDEKHCS